MDICKVGNIREPNSKAAWVIPLKTSIYDSKLPASLFCLNMMNHNADAGDKCID